jgi:hypothetical protein
MHPWCVCIVCKSDSALKRVCTYVRVCYSEEHTDVVNDTCIHTRTVPIANANRSGHGNASTSGGAAICSCC